MFNKKNKDYLTEESYILKSIVYNYTIIGEYYSERYDRWYKFRNINILDSVNDNIKLDVTVSGGLWFAKQDLILYFDTTKNTILRRKIEERIKGKE